MASACPQVSGSFFPPNRRDCQDAVSRAILRLRSNGGWTRDKLASELGCSPDTIDNATNEKGMMSFEFIAMLAFKFSDEFSLIESLWNCRATAPLTVSERLARIESDTAAIRREVA